MKTYFKYHSSFSGIYEPCQDGIALDERILIIRLLKAKAEELKGILVFCGDGRFGGEDDIYYGVLDFDGLQVDYFSTTQDLIDYLLPEEE